MCQKVCQNQALVSPAMALARKARWDETWIIQTATLRESRCEIQSLRDYWQKLLTNTTTLCLIIYNTIYLSIYLSIYLCIYVCMSIYQFIYLSIYIYICNSIIYLHILKALKTCVPSSRLGKCCGVRSKLGSAALEATAVFLEPMLLFFLCRVCVICVQQTIS